MRSRRRAGGALSGPAVRRGRFLAGSLAVLLGGCAGVPAPPPGAGPGAAPARGELAVPPGAATGPRAAVVALVDDAGRQERGGHLGAAAASLERALRIAPADASLWRRLARLRLQQGRFGQAEQLARRALLAAGSDRAAAAAAWRIVAAARSARGDDSGARRAQARAAALEAR